MLAFDGVMVGSTLVSRKAALGVLWLASGLSVAAG